MNKPDKYKSLTKTTLFGEKLIKAREQKINIEKPPPATPIKKNLPLIVSPPIIIEKLKPIERIADDIKPIRLEIKVETNKIDTSNELNFPIAIESAPTNEFRQIMERHFEGNLSLVKPMLINLGVDLGTSFSKVVWRRIGGDYSYPVCFGENHQNLADYLVPSTVSFDKTEVICGVDSENNFAPLFSLANFKMW